MVISRTEMKRKRRDECSSPLLDESPKRTKVHAQRKFAQGSNVNSPVITPVKEIEKQEMDVLPEPVELLPIKRPNTEDFLTFLCFRGTPILPPSLNFFNTASIVDTNGQVHEIKSESPKNGPIDTSAITKSGSGSSERPFIAFGVRKRADPIVISRQMDKKRRHALALQALRRKYQEQRMAKIRAVTISKLSEKVSSKTLLRSNSVTKNETGSKKSTTVQKTKVKVIPTDHVNVKVAARSVRATLRPQIKQKMCLRSFRGRFVQKELQFRNVKKRTLPVKKPEKNIVRKVVNKEEFKDSSDYSSDDEKPLSKTSDVKKTPKVIIPKIAKKTAPGPKKPMEINFRITRSNKFLNNKVVLRRQQIKQRMIMTTPKTIVKPRTLRSNTAPAKLLSEKTHKVVMKAKKNIENERKEGVKKESSPLRKDVIKKESAASTKESKKELSKETGKKESTVSVKESSKKELTTKETNKKELTVQAKETNKKEATVSTKESNKKQPTPLTKKDSAVPIKEINKKELAGSTKELNKKELTPVTKEPLKKESAISAKEVNKKESVSAKEPNKKESVAAKEPNKKESASTKESNKKESVSAKEPNKKESVSAKELNKKEPTPLTKKIIKATESTKENSKKDETGAKKETKAENLKKAVGKSTEFLKKELSPTPTLGKNKSDKVSNVKKEIENAKKAKIIPKQTIVKKESINENLTKKEILVKKKQPLVVKKGIVKPIDNTVKKETTKQELLKVEETEKKPDVVKTNTDQKDTIELRTSQRPTRKTKEAAAIYMEILSHKLVNESRIDDDNVSIDSFPELPNVKKTEQRENELKAKARSTKTSESELSGDAKKTIKSKEKEVDVSMGKILRSSDKKKVNAQNDVKISVEKIEDKKLEPVKQETNNEDEKSKKNVVETKKCNPKVEEVCDRKTRSTNQEKLPEKVVLSPVEKVKEVELKVHINPIEITVDKKTISKVEDKEPPAKKKCNEKVDVEIDSDSSDKPIVIPPKIDKPVKPNESEITKRQTRNSSMHIKHVESDDSDESFRADIIIPRKKQITRSKVSKLIDSENEESIKKSLRASARSYKECSSSDSDQSTTSDINVKQPKVMNKNKKFTKTRGQQKGDQSFSDSDEEPLSKLTQNRSIEIKEVVDIKADIGLERKNKVEIETKPVKTTKDKEKVETEEKETFTKPKRECAKRPQNYLPMFSSSDEEDNYFHGFVKTENKPKTTKPPEISCTHVPATSDLSCKDIGRRFGKGKVNMSTEQIEKWLKDSAMAGSSVKNENDAMLKFGEKIPTETSHSIATSIDTEKLKCLLITNAEKQDSDVEKKEISPKAPSNEILTLIKQSGTIKPIITDRKLIFRTKVKSGAVSNINAFSASNENSVYAFGEESEDIMKTPFRRPTRRPSSTATSKSEEESSKYEEITKTGQFRKPPLMKQDSTKSKDSVVTDEICEEKVHLSSDDNTFYIPLQPQLPGANNKNKIGITSGQKVDKRSFPSTSMVPPAVTSQKLSNLKHLQKQTSRDGLEELKYKVPSSPSASSSSSAKLYKRQTSKPKFRATEILPVKLPDFPIGGPCGQLIEAPTFHPTEKEFQDPLEYIEKIRSKAEQFGICRIVPPSTFKPECKVTDDMRFTAYNQYVHKMLHRWGPNFKELMAIKRYLSTQNISLTHPPWIGGMEIDLPRLYQTVQSLGGLKEVIEKKKWPKVSDAMKIPKSAQDRVTKLDDIYCKYLLPYDTLSPAEREKLFDEVETEWAKRESKSLLKAQQNIDDNTTEMESESDDEAEECILKGRSMALNAFYRIARNTMSMWFKNPEPLAEEVEQEFWKHVTQKQNHICVHSGSIDSGNWGYGFAVSKNSPFARHAWNLKVLTNNSGSVLRSMGPVMGVTVPTLHVGMVFSSCCWYRDPHSLPWTEYLHTGGNKIWYGIPDSTSAAFHAALKTLVPNYCRNKSLWLPSDTVMVPPNLLVENGVSLCRIVQQPGQFIVVFPKVFTSSLSTGYVVSESVYFAPPYWLRTGRVVFDELRNSCEPSMFSYERLLLSIVNDARSNVEVLKQIIPSVQELCDKEKSAREKIKSLGVSAIEKLPLPEAPRIRKKKKLHNDDGDYECEICRMSLFISMVTESQEDAVFCLEHAAEQIEQKKIQSKHCKLTFTYDDLELNGLVEKINMAITNKLQKKVPIMKGLPILTTVVPVGPDPTHMICPHCHAEIDTTTYTRPGNIAYIAATLICLMGCAFGCCLIPCCIDNCMDVYHTCPNCKAYLGKFQRR